MYHWLKNSLTEKAKSHTKVATEMLVRRELQTLLQLTEEYGQTIGITLVSLEQKRANEQKCFKIMMFALLRWVSARYWTFTSTVSILGWVKWIVYIALWVSPSMTKAAVKSVVRSYVECQSINPASVHWRKGRLNADNNWSQLRMDITNYNSGHFLKKTEEYRKELTWQVWMNRWTNPTKKKGVTKDSFCYRES